MTKIDALLVLTTITAHNQAQPSVGERRAGSEMINRSEDQVQKMTCACVQHHYSCFRYQKHLTSMWVSWKCSLFFGTWIVYRLVSLDINLHQNKTTANSGIAAAPERTMNEWRSVAVET